MEKTPLIDNENENISNDDPIFYDNNTIVSDLLSALSTNRPSLSKPDRNSEVLRSIIPLRRRFLYIIKGGLPNEVKTQNIDDA